MLTLLALLTIADSTRIRPVVVAPAESLYTIAAGSGAPVVLINGLVGGVYGWRKVTPALTTRGYEVIALEPLGMGNSSRPRKADYSLTAQADRVGRALDSLGVRSAILVAHSLGASIALRLAYRRPDLVRAILSIEGGPEEEAAAPGLRRAMRWAPLLKLFVGRGTIRREVRNGLLSNSSDSTWLTPEVLERYTAPEGRNIGATLDAYRAMARSREPESLRDHLASIRVPVRLLVGAVPHESSVKPAEEAELAELLPDFALERVAGSGQLVHEEQPMVVVDALLQLDRTAPP